MVWVQVPTLSLKVRIWKFAQLKDVEERFLQKVYAVDIIPSYLREKNI